MAFTLARERIRHLDAVLKKLTSTFETVRCSVEDYDVRLSVGIENLPDEVIEWIIHFSCADWKFLVDVSRVSKRFRRVALSSPRLWAACVLTLDMPPVAVDLVASRAASIGLNVKIVETSREVLLSPMDRLTVLFKYSARWKSAILKLSRTTAVSISAYFPNPDLGALVNLDIENHIYTKWLMPSLRSLKLYNHNDVLAVSFAEKVPQLTECRLLLDIHRYNFLSGVSGLTTLNLRICDEQARDIARGTMTLNFPILKNLGLDFALASETGGNIVDLVLPAVSCPNITALTLCINEGSVKQSDGAVSVCWRVLPLLRDLYPFLRSFSLFMQRHVAIRNVSESYRLYFVDDILQHLPGTIESIGLAAWSIPLLSHRPGSAPDALQSSHPRLRSVNIEHTPWMEDSLLSKIAKQLHQRKIELKELEFKFSGNVRTYKREEPDLYNVYYYV